MPRGGRKFAPHLGIILALADLVKLVYTLASGASARKGVGVRVPRSAPYLPRSHGIMRGLGK